MTSKDTLTTTTKPTVPPRPKPLSAASATTPSLEIYRGNWDSSVLPRLAIHHFGIELLEEFGGSESETMFGYKAGQIAKKHMDFFGWKDRTAFYDAKSWDLPYSLTPVSGLVSSANPLVMELTWPVDTIANTYKNTTMGRMIRNPKIMLMHSAHLCSLPEVDVARLADLMVMCADGVQVDHVYPKLDDADLYLYIISNDPRFQLLFSSFNHLKHKMPLCFYVGSLSEHAEEESANQMLKAVNMSSCQMKLTNSMVEEEFQEASLSMGHMVSDNPMFMGGNVITVPKTASALIDPFSQTTFGSSRKRSRVDHSDLFTEIEEE